jgi:FKBP-type peptidyl-prolyl cis-trans isomerase FkpA
MNKSLVLSAGMALALVSCKNSDFEGFTKAETGLHYKFFNHDENGQKPNEGDGVAFTFTIKKHSNDSTIADSKNQSRDGVFRYMLPKSSFNGSIEDGMKMMSKGDSASFVISADSFFIRTNKMQQLPPYVRPGEFLTVNVKIVDVKSPKEVEAMQKQQQADYEKEMQRMQAEEATKRDQYIAENKITTKPLESGLYYIEVKKGAGPKPKATDEVTIHYTGTLLDGTKFDSSLDKGEPLTYPVANFIAGWTEALQLMSKGTKAKLIIPSNIGYGPQGSGPIPPFSTLLFEIELLDFKPAPAAPPTTGH